MMPPSPRRGSLAYWAAAALALFVMGCAPTSATTALPPAGSEIVPAVYVPPEPAPAGGTGHFPSDAAFFGQVDVFIDLACEKSAAAWPTLKRIVKDQRHRVDFVFHILPLSEFPIGYFAAKTVQVILANSGGTYDDVEPFIDWVFRGQRIILHDEGMEMTVDAREVVTDWALSSSSLSPEKLYSDMKDPTFDERVLEDLDTPFLTTVEETPTALFNGIFMMHLEGEKQLRDYEIFLEGADFNSAYDGLSNDDNDDWLIYSPMWMELERGTKDEYEEMERIRKAQQVAREQRKFEQVEMRAQQQLQELGVQQQEQLKQLLHLQQEQLKHLLLRQDQLQPPADVQRASPSSSSALGFSTLSYYALSPDFDLAVSSLPPSSSFASSTSSPPEQPYSAPTAPSSSPSPTQSSWPTFFSLRTPLISDWQKVENLRSAGDGSSAEAAAFEAGWAAAKRDDQQQHLRQHRHQQQGLQLRGDLLSSFFRSFFGWAKSFVATSEEIVQEESGGAGGREQQGWDGGAERGAGSEVGKESVFNLKTYTGDQTTRLWGWDTRVDNCRGCEMSI